MAHQRQIRSGGFVCSSRRILLAALQNAVVTRQACCCGQRWHADKTAYDLPACPLMPAATPLEQWKFAEVQDKVPGFLYNLLLRQ
jgi:hypothetical protein